MADWLTIVSLSAAMLEDGMRRSMVGERWFSTWLRSGLQYNHAVLAAQASSRAISGLVADEPALNGTSQPPQQLAAQYPNANLLASALADPDVVFEISVRSIIDGLYNKLK